MSDYEGSGPTEGIDYGHSMVVWPSTGLISGGDVKPGGSSGIAPSMPPGWGDYSPQGIALVQSVLFPGIIRRIILDKELEEGDWSGWSVSVHSPWGNEKVSAARTVLENGLRGGLPEPSRPAAVSFARLEPASGNEQKIIRLMVTQQLEQVTDIPASQLPAAGNNVPVKYRLMDLMQNGTQYMAIIGGIPMTVPVVDAVPVPDRSRPGTNIKDVYSAPVSPNLPDLVLSVGQMNTPVLSNPEIQEEGVIAETGNYVEAGYTMSSNNHDVIVRFPDGSGVSPLYISTVEILDSNGLSQRQEAENKAKDDFRVKKEEAVARAEAEKAKAELFSKAGVNQPPVYTQEMMERANSVMNEQGALVLNNTASSVQLAMTGTGVWTAAGDIAGNISKFFSNALEKVTIPEVSPLLMRISLGALWFHSEEAGAGSDIVPGRNLEAMFSLSAQMLAGQGVVIEPGATSVNLPVRGQLINSNGQLALDLLKTGNESIPAAVPVLNAVRDTATGLDKITLPAVVGAPSRTILVNPVPQPSVPTDTGNHQPVPVTPVHTGTEVKPVEMPVTTITPVSDVGGLRDFIYWRPDAAGTGVEAVYVMLNDPLDSGRFSRKQLDKKYKHAGDFGISDTKKNRETLTKFRDAIEEHLSDKDTVEKGTYRREKGSKVYFNPNTMNVVIIKSNGEFLSGWKINPDADDGRIYLETGEL
ncbi:colicin-D [Escherichia coli]|nr:colicin-D [Escherichia coli]